MKRIAIITPCILPVPASKGGAVEGLITKIINDNERLKDYSIDLFTIADDAGSNNSFSYTNTIKVESSGIIRTIDRLSDKYYRTVPGLSSTRKFDDLIVKSFSDRLKEIQGSYDAVIVENIMSTAAEIAKICRGSYDFPIYFHMHNDVDTYRSPEYIRELTRVGVQFIAVSDYIKKRILQQDANAKVYTLYNGVDLSEYRRIEKRTQDVTTFLYAGRIIPGKGVKELLLAFDRLADNAKLVIAGFSGLDKRYEGEIHRLADKSENIECIDQIPAKEMPSLYEKADVVVMPTIDEEPFGLVALETMAKGIVLITTNSGALPEVVGDGACIVDKTGDFVANIADAMAKVAEDAACRHELSDRAYRRAHAMKEFDLANYYQGFCQIIGEEQITDEDTISVIVPVYNVSPYLRRCLDSITDQTYSNLEIVLVDDGSTDDSGSICEEYASKDERIRVIHQDNMGLSGARNTGIESASGKYLFFCDSADYLKNDALEKMLHRLKRDHADVVASGFTWVYDDPSKEYPYGKSFTDDKPGSWSGHESVIQMMRSNNICTVAWNKLYKKNLFEDIRFPLGVKNEDEATTYKLLYKAGMVSYIPEVLYNYYQRDESIMHEELDGRYRDFLTAIYDRMAFFKEKDEDDLVQHSRLTLLEWIKYSYRNIDNRQEKNNLLGEYKNNINFSNAPSVMGRKKQQALL